MTVRRIRLAIVAALVAAASGSFAVPVSVRAQDASPSADAGAGADGMPELAWERFTLSNGLTVIVHEDHRSPIVGVMVWYHVGSRNERPGRTGFAHLFEHLMFNGSEHHDDDWFKPVARLGATGVNGTTNSDRTNYFQVVPTSALDSILWLESDRMGWTERAVSQERLDEQRGVVQNEKRQGENQPYGLQWDAVTTSTWPAGHPYSWTTIGSMEDLDAASLEDVRLWFRTWYGPDNATLVLTGDVDLKSAREKVARYFGDIPPGPPLRRFTSLEAPRRENSRMEMQDRVPLPRVVKVWNTPGWGTADADLLEVAATALGDGAGSRLRRRLEDTLELASEIEVFQDSMEIAGQFWVIATAAPGVPIEKLESALDNELQTFLDEGPTADELAVARARLDAAFLRRLERVGGFGGKADLLAEGQVFGGSPDAWKVTWERRRDADPDEVAAFARKWLSQGSFTLVIRPRGRFAPSAEGADRSAMPAPGTPPEAAFPALHRTSLENGLPVVVASRSGSPLVEVRLLVRSGHGTSPGAPPGAARAVAETLVRGAAGRSAGEISRAADLLGATLVAEAGVEWTTVSLTVPRAKAAEGMALLADVALRPDFTAEEVRRVGERLSATAAQERVDARALTRRVLPVLLYGESHPYAVSHTGASESAPSREAVVGLHRRAWVPGNARLLMAGDLEPGVAAALAKTAFGAWTGSVDASPAPPPPAPRPGLYLVDRPGAVQSMVLAAGFLPPPSEPGEPAMEVFVQLFGGSFTSRLNMNLREDKHWAYGARARPVDFAGPRPFSAGASVQTDRTADSLSEILREIREVRGDRPPTEEERADALRSMTLALPGRWETTENLADALVAQETLGLSPDHNARYAARIRAVTLDQVQAAARGWDADHLVLLVIGDREVVEGPLKALGLGDPVLLDADGRVIAK